MTEKSEVPEKIYLDMNDYEAYRYGSIDKLTRLSYSFKSHWDSVHEYILKSLHLKIKNDWFARGLKAGKISKNTSGCCCVIDDDGETISSLCGAHKALHDKKEAEAYTVGYQNAKKRFIKMQNETCPICESPLEDNGICSDVGSNNCQYLKGVE